MDDQNLPQFQMLQQQRQKEMRVKRIVCELEREERGRKKREGTSTSGTSAVVVDGDDDVLLCSQLKQMVQQRSMNMDSPISLSILYRCQGLGGGEGEQVGANLTDSRSSKDVKLHANSCFLTT